MRSLAALLLALATALAPTPAAATVVDFDAFAARYDYTMSAVETGGLRFAVNCQPCLGVEDRPPTTLAGDPLPGAYNGTASLLYAVDPLTISATDGASFYLDRLDLGLSFYVPDGDVGGLALLTLTLAGGGTQAISVTLDRSYSTVAVGRQVLGLSISGGRSFGYVTLDNVVINDLPEPLPEPGSAGLAALALLGAGLAARHRPRA